MQDMNYSVYDQFKQKIMEATVYKSDPKSKEYIHELEEKKSILDEGFKVLIANLLADHKNDLDFLASIINTKDEEAVKATREHIFYSYSSFIDDDCSASKELISFNKELNSSNKSLLEYMKDFEAKVIETYGKDSNQVKAFYKQSQPIIRKSYGHLNDSKNILSFFEKLDNIPNIDKYIDLKSVVSMFEDPSIADTHPYHDKIIELTKGLANDHPLKENVEFLDGIIVKGKDDFCGVTSSIAENVGQEYDRDIVAVAAKGLNTIYDDVKFKANKSSLEVVDEKKANMAKVAHDGANFEMKMDPTFKKNFLEVAKLYKENLYLPPYLVEEGTKHYAFKSLANLRNQIASAIDNKNIEELTKLTQEYKDKEIIFNDLLAKSHDLYKNNAFTANISVSRNTTVPSKYRNDYVRISQLGGIHHLVGLCESLGVELEAVLDNPVKAFYDMNRKMLESTELSKALHEGKSPIEMFRAIKKLDTRQDFNMLMLNVRAFARAGSCITNSYQGPDREKMIGHMSFLSENIAQIKTVSLMSTYMKPLGNAYGIANLFFLKNEDLNVYTLNDSITDAISVYDYDTVKKVELDKYISNKLSVQETIARCKEIYALSKEIDAKLLKNLDALLSGTFASVDKSSPLPLAENYMNIIRTGKDPLLDSMSLEDSKNKNESILDFGNKLFDLVKTIKANEALSISESVENVKYNELTNNTVEYCINAFVEQMESCEISFDALGYSKDFVGIKKFLVDYQAGKKELDKASLPKNFFDSMKEKSSENLYQLNEIPNDVFTTENMDFAEGLVASSKRDVLKHAFRDSSSMIRGINDKEKSFENPSAYATSAGAANQFVKDIPEMAPCFKIGTAISTFKLNENPEATKGLASMLGEFKLSDNTKDAIIQIYDKMNSYHMLDNETKELLAFGEEPTKVMGLYKYYMARNEYKKALDAKDYDKAYELAPKSNEIINEYLDVYKLTEKLLPQDGLHCNGNISCTRHEYVPHELSDHLQAHIQTNAIFLLNTACKRYSLDFKEVINNPSLGIKKMMEGERKRISDFYKSGPKGALFGRLTNREAFTNGDKLLARAIETLTVLESDEKTRQKNSIIGIVQEALRTNLSVDQPFAIYNGVTRDNNFVRLDMDALKSFIATGGNRDIYEYANNNFDVLTGEKPKPLDYNEILVNDNRSLAEVYKDVIENVSGGLLQVNRDMNGDEYEDNQCTYCHIYAAASAYLQDFIYAKGLEHDNSFVKSLVDKFINDPVASVRDYINENLSKEKDELDEFYMKDYNLANILEEVKTPDSIAMTAVSHYKDLNNANVNDLSREFDRIKSTTGPEVNSENIMYMMNIAKKANEKYYSRNRIARFFSRTASKEYKLAEKIVNYAKSLGVNEDLITDAFDTPSNEENNQKLATMLSTITSQARYTEYMNRITPEGINRQLDAIFKENVINSLTPQEKKVYYNSTNLTKSELKLKAQVEERIKTAPNQKIDKDNLDKAIDLFKGLKEIERNAPNKTILETVNKSINMFTKALNDKGILTDFIYTVADGSMTSEEAIASSKEVVNPAPVKNVRENIALDLNSGNIILDIDELPDVDMNELAKDWDKNQNEPSNDKDGIEP